MNDPGDSSCDTDGATRETLCVDVDVHAGDWSWLGDKATAIEPVCRAVASALLEAGDTLSADLALADDAQIQALNQTWRGQDKPTNVLSFPAASGTGGDDNFLGDIIMAEQTLRAEAASAGIPDIHHFQHLLVHGLLHLMGYDHEDADEAEEMEALETRILAQLGVPDPYAGTEPIHGHGPG